MSFIWYIEDDRIILCTKNENEQIKIVEFLDKQTSQIDTLCLIKEKKIEKLNQYKKSIIYEYVTGKKEA